MNSIERGKSSEAGLEIGLYPYRDIKPSRVADLGNLTKGSEPFPRETGEPLRPAPASEPIDDFQRRVKRRKFRPGNKVTLGRETKPGRGAPEIKPERGAPEARPERGVPETKQQSADSEQINRVPINEAFKDAGPEANAFLSKTVTAFEKWATLKLLDLIAPGLGSLIETFERIVNVAKLIKTMVDGKGEIGIPLTGYDGLEFRLDVHVGEDSDGLPVTAFLSPEQVGSLPGGFEANPESDGYRALVVDSDLSLEQVKPDERAAIVSAYAEARLRRELTAGDCQEIDLALVRDRSAEYVAFLGFSGTKSQWCIVIWHTRRITVRAGSITYAEPNR